MDALKAAIEKVLNAEDKTAAILDLFNAILAYMVAFIGGEI